MRAAPRGRRVQQALLGLLVPLVAVVLLVSPDQPAALDSAEQLDLLELRVWQAQPEAPEPLDPPELEPLAQQE